MKVHLTQDELLALAEGARPVADTARHLETCGDCRRQADELRALLADLREADVPEPSPLFWEHFSARVADAVRDEALVAAPPAWWRRPAGWAWTLGGATAVATLLLVAFGPFGPAPAVPSPDATSVVADTDPGAEAERVTIDGEDWSLIADAVDGLDYDDVRAIGASLPATAELAVRDLDADEQRELARLLREELARLAPGSAETL